MAHFDSATRPNGRFMVGNALLKALVSEGWRVVSEYSDQMIDKGVDFDSYTLKRDGKKIRMEWDNWQEWSITGEEEVIGEVSKRLAQKQSED